MHRNAFPPVASMMLLFCVVTPTLAANPIRGKYVEARTCQVYTGPCFANGEVGLTGKDAVMAWRIDHGDFEGVGLSGLSVAVIVKTSHTLGFYGFDGVESTKALVIVDEAADASQSAALRAFAIAQTQFSPEQIVGSYRADFDMEFDMSELTAKIDVGKFVHLQTRKARPGDCICSNESAYYPPLADLNGFVPSVTIDGQVTARRLGTRWSIPDSRTAYLGTFYQDGVKPLLVKAR